MDLKYCTIIIILFSEFVHGADDQFCSTSSSRRPYGDSCSDSSQCTTNNCNNYRCLCPSNAYYHNCKAACVLSCNATSQDAIGTIVSHDYPLQYPNNLYCKWTLTGAPNTYYIFSISDMEMEETSQCYYDSLGMYSGPSGSTQLALLCKRNANGPQTIASLANSMEVVFKTNELRAFRGFSGSYQRFDNNMTLRDSVFGHIASPGYPRTYPTSSYFSWNIEGKNGTFVSLRILNFSLAPTWANDFVQVFDGPNDTSPSLVKMCATTFEPLIMSTKPFLRIVLRTSNAKNVYGFEASYQVNDCQTTLTEPSGYIVSPGYPYEYIPYLNCTWTIIADPNKLIFFRITNFSLEPQANCSFDHLKMYDGPNTQANLLGTYCINAPDPPVIVSTNNALHLHFKTDRSINNPGFRGIHLTVARPITYPCYNSTQCPQSPVCRFDMCVCPDNFYCNNTIHTCLAALEDPSPCNPSVRNMCKGPDFECRLDNLNVTRCLCVPGLYRTWTQCAPYSELGVRLSSHPKITTNDILFTWTTGSPSRYPTTYKITWSATEDSLDMGEMPASNNGVHVHGLTPGQEYVFTVVTTLGANSFYNTTTVYTKFTVVTRMTKVPLIAGVTTGSIVVVAVAIVVIVIFVRKRKTNRTSRTDGNVTKTCNDEISVTGKTTNSTHPGGRTMNEYRTTNNEDMSMTGRTTDNAPPGGRTMNNDDIRTGDNQAESDYDCIRESVMASWKEGTYVNTKEIENAHRRDQQEEDDVYQNVAFDQN
ncbi:unnamed protein product [Lymnaea stagnalis]|uniref:Cubilin n=1 Tax=Lymnaea stagnalis TaxID=6523 RepID=A0AAV2IJR3_LYMST